MEFELDENASSHNNDNEEKIVKWNHRFPIDIDPFPEEESNQSYEIFDLNEENAIKRDDFVPSHLPPFPPSHTIEKKGSKRKHSQTTTPANQPNKKIAPEVIKNASAIAAKNSHHGKH